MNHSFLDFDEPAVHEQFNVIDQKHHFALDEFSHAEGARYQHSIDVEIMKQLLEIVKRQDQILRLCAGVAMIAQNQPPVFYQSTN